jgi:hypothetical protein
MQKTQEIYFLTDNFSKFETIYKLVKFFRNTELNPILVHFAWPMEKKTLF